MKAKRVLSILFMAMAMSLLTLRATAAEPATAAPAALQFKILHTNDLHAHDEAFVEKGRNVGGMARIAHLIRAERAKNPNVLAIDAGDIFQGTSFFRVYQVWPLRRACSFRGISSGPIERPSMLPTSPN